MAAEAREVNKIPLKFQLHPFGPGAAHSLGDQVIVEGLDSYQHICVLCTKMFSASPNSSSAMRTSALTMKKTIAEIAFVDVAFLSVNDERVGFCHSCEIIVNQLCKIYENFLHIRNELISLSTEVRQSLVQTNKKLLQRANNEDLIDTKSSHFNAWNLDKVHKMLLSNLLLPTKHLEDNGEKNSSGFAELVSSIQSPETRSFPLGAPDFPMHETLDSAETDFERPDYINDVLLPGVATIEGDQDLGDIHGMTLEKMMVPVCLVSSLENNDRQTISNNLNCHPCNETFTSEELLQIHLLTHNNAGNLNEIVSKVNSSKGKFACTFCKKLFTRSYSFKTHMRTHEGQGKDSLSCDKCDKKFISEKTLKAHIKMHMGLGKRLLTCPICSKTMNQQRSLDTHLLRHHTQDFNSTKATCDVCDKTFQSILLLMNHMTVHRGDFQCDVPSCRKSFKSISHLEKHEQVHRTDGEVFDCDFCMSNFEDKISLEVHVATHNFSQSFLCDHCGKSFSSKHLLITHLRMHKNMEFRCEICDKNFYSSSNLKYHQRLHTGERPFQCPECTQTFAQKASLTLHMRKHSGVNPFTCSYCKNSGFSYKLAYRQHLATKHPEIYLQSKKFLCKTCWKNFGEESELLEHQVVHEKHKCKLCNRQFKMLVHLKEHLLRHASLKPHKCIFCDDKAFLRKKSLVDHITKCHPNEDVEAATETDNNITYIVHIST